MTRVWIAVMLILILAAAGAALSSDWPVWLTAAIVAGLALLSYAFLRSAVPTAARRDE